MARIVNTLAGRLGVIVVIGQLLLLPALYVMLDWIVTRSHHERFVTEIRTYARLLADEFELGTATASDERTKALLDNVLLSGEGVFAELTLDGHVVRADLEGPGPKARFSAEDFEFGQGGDETYFLMVPIQHEKQEGELRIGFDEGPVTAQIERTRERILVALTLFFGVSVLASILLGYRFSRPLVALQRAARRVAAGTELARLDTDSDIAELQELARDLEFMRACARRCVSVALPRTSAGGSSSGWQGAVDWRRSARWRAVSRTNSTTSWYRSSSTPSWRSRISRRRARSAPTCSAYTARRSAHDASSATSSC